MNIHDIIEKRLSDVFCPSVLDVVNESHMHNVAPGAESHFKVTIVCDDFEGLSLIKRHRLVNKALQKEMTKIHALALHTMTKDEYFEKAGKVAESPLCKGGGKNQ